jgi:hypothetical protein
MIVCLVFFSLCVECRSEASLYFDLVPCWFADGAIPHQSECFAVRPLRQQTGPAFRTGRRPARGQVPPSGRFLCWPLTWLTWPWPQPGHNDKLGFPFKNTKKRSLTCERDYWPDLENWLSVTVWPLSGVGISFSRHSPNWRVVQNFNSPKQKTTGPMYGNGQWEGKKKLARLASKLAFLLAKPEFHSHLVSWRVFFRTPAFVLFTLDSCITAIDNFCLFGFFCLTTCAILQESYRLGPWWFCYGSSSVWGKQFMVTFNCVTTQSLFH